MPGSHKCNNVSNYACDLPARMGQNVLREKRSILLSWLLIKSSSGITKRSAVADRMAIFCKIKNWLCDIKLHEAG